MEKKKKKQEFIYILILYNSSFTFQVPLTLILKTINIFIILSNHLLVYIFMFKNHFYFHTLPLSIDSCIFNTSILVSIILLGADKILKEQLSHQKIQRSDGL